ncbi:glycosyltransferase family 39 protein [Bacillus pseudomycoides]|uniref:Glycosyltransferase family 39 protein n=1 Tax=Bacillus bingmayongensis TaxID=1150157 RepID=A0ABU5JT17_9BACI|nr:glycosyltransferase family 39 protein [Bacillus pseudomycoides]
MKSISSTKINSLLTKCLLILCLIIFIFTTWNSVIITRDTFWTRILIIFPIIVIILLLLLLLGYIVNKYISQISFIVLLTILAFSIRLIWIITIPTLIESDFEMLYNSAVQAANGDFSFAQGTYFTTWVYQLGFTMYQAFIIKLFGEGAFPLKLLNVLYCTGTALLIYLITKKVFNEWSGRIAGLLYSLYIPSIMMTSVLTNQHLATFLFYLGFYLLIAKGLSSQYTWIFIGLTLSLGDIIRPLGMLILVAVVIYIFLQGMLGQPKKVIFNSFKKLSGILIVFYLVHYVISYAFITSGITQYPLSNRDSLWKFVLGFNHETRGSYSDTDAAHIMSFEIGEKREAEEKRIIKERLADKQEVLALFKNKFALMWGDIDASPYWSLNMEGKEDLKETSLKYERYMYIATMLFGIVSLLSLIATKQKNYYYTPFCLLIIGYILIHFLIEIQARYRYFIIPSFTIIQIYGIYMCYKLITKRTVTKRNNVKTSSISK